MLQWIECDVYRTFLHEMLKPIATVIKPGDVVLDVGAGKKESYRSLLPNVITVDIVEENEPDICCDISKHIPVEDNTVDHVLAMNVLEHVYDHQNAIAEVFRVLKPGGTFWGFVPFMINIHGDPNDYYRYTPQTIRRLLADCGFTNIKIQKLAGAPMLIAQLLSFLPVVWRFTKPLFWIARLMTNRLEGSTSSFAKISKECVLAIFFSGDKPEIKGNKRA